MLPEPFEKFVSVLRKVNPSPAFTALINKMNEYIATWKKEAIDLKYFNDIVRCPAEFLEELGAKFGVVLDSCDSEQTKRKKIYSAVAGYKKAGSWTQDVKPKIDAVTGYNAELGTVNIADSDDSIEMSYEVTDPDTYWSTESAFDGGDPLLGTAEIGTSTELSIPGNIYINLHTSETTPVLTPEQIDRLVIYLEKEVIPAYMFIYLGYLDGTGTFIVYAVIKGSDLND